MSKILFCKVLKYTPEKYFHSNVTIASRYKDIVGNLMAGVPISTDPNNEETIIQFRHDFNLHNYGSYYIPLKHLKVIRCHDDITIDQVVYILRRIRDMSSIKNTYIEPTKHCRSCHGLNLFGINSKYNYICTFHKKQAIIKATTPEELNGHKICKMYIEYVSNRIYNKLKHEG